MILTSKKIVNSVLIHNLGDMTIQTQSVGMDLRVKKICLWKSAGEIDFDNKERKLALFEEIPWSSDKIHLKSGGYFVQFEEFITVPLNLVGFLYPRSTLMRNGVVLDSSLFDPGYSGPMSAVLYVINPHGLNIKRGARIAQCLFIQTEEKLENGYKGIYQNKPIE